MRILTVCILLISSNAYATLQSPFLPRIEPIAPDVKKVDDAPVAPSLPVQDIVYYEEKVGGNLMTATIIDQKNNIKINNNDLKTVSLKEGSKVSTQKDSYAECNVAGIQFKIWSNSIITLNELRALEKHKEIEIGISKGRIRLKSNKKYIGALSIITPSEKIISHNANLMVSLENKPTVWNLSGSVEIITKNQKLILMPGERADRRGSVWSVSALLNPNLISELKNSFAFKSEQKLGARAKSSPHHYVETLEGSSQP